MKKKFNHTYTIKVFALSIATFAFVACSSQETKQKKRQDEITAYAEAINTNPTALNPQKADTMINLYNNYIKDYPQDTMSEFYLFQMYNIYSAMNNCDSALACLDRIIKEYPNGKKVGAAYFFKGVVLNDVCLNKEESIKAFEKYIELYPDNPHVETAKRMIQLDTMKKPMQLLEDNNDNGAK